MTNNLTLVCTNEQGCQIEKESGVLQLTLSKNAPQAAITWEIVNQATQTLRLEPLLLGDVDKTASITAVEIKAGETQTTKWLFSADENWFNNQEDQQLSFDYIWRIEEAATETKPVENSSVINNYYTTNHNGQTYSTYLPSSAIKTVGALNDDKTKSVDVFTAKESPLEITGEVLGAATESPPAAAQSSLMKGSWMIDMQTTGAKIAMIALLLLFLLLMAMFVWKRYRKSPK